MNGKQPKEKESGSAEVPPEAAWVKDLLASMGVDDYEPRIVTQLLECMYRHVSDILQDADTYRQRASNPTDEIGMEELLLAIQARESFSFVQPPPQSVLNELAAKQNKQPLPELSERPGLQIPVHSLAGPSYQMTVEAEPVLPPEAAAAAGGGVEEGAGNQQGSSIRRPPAQPQQLDLKLNRGQHQQQQPPQTEWMDTA